MDCLSNEAEGLLCLYEASYLGMTRDAVLEEAMEFSVSCLKSSMKDLGNNLAEQVRRSLEVPLHWRMVRLEARNFINVCGKEHTKKSSSILVELAMLDFNIVQSVHQRDLQELSRWWRDLAFEEELCFARDRLVENFMWTVGIIYKPGFSKCRIGLTKLISILMVIDDIYDVYGSLDELELFTNAVDRWDIKAVEELPNYMKSCYLALLNFGNGIIYDAQRDHVLNILPNVKKEWARLCRAYMMEARWFYKGYTPGLEEYLGNAWISVGGPAAMVHAYFMQLQGRTLSADESLDCLKALNYGSGDLFYWASIITRLTDDLGTSQAEMERGDVPKSIQCYMNEKGVPEGEAREHIEGLVRDSWKKLNECAQSCGLPRWVVDMALNMARTSQCIFHHGDGIGTPGGVTKDRVVSLFIEPLS
ncbi:probable terpene synthase 9 isoform X1 [Telopea speciosissima]|uniref:probable terpene synthase 9 isoform X1 n=2 Tax=Telopea speciosissima TaxID=54955 RepID=UPI001CC68A26|nr:probable terpene synthase 9 isoform X1 [Telopea speciosissima]